MCLTRLGSLRLSVSICFSRQQPVARLGEVWAHLVMTLRFSPLLLLGISDTTLFLSVRLAWDLSLVSGSLSELIVPSLCAYILCIHTDLCLSIRKNVLCRLLAL